MAYTIMRDEIRRQIIGRAWGELNAIRRIIPAWLPGAGKEKNVHAWHVKLHTTLPDFTHQSCPQRQHSRKTTRLEPHGSNIDGFRGGWMPTSFQSHGSSLPSLCFQALSRRGGGSLSCGCAHAFAALQRTTEGSQGIDCGTVGLLLLSYLLDMCLLQP